MKYHFTAEARDDLREAATFYETQRDGLGAEFLVEVGIAIAQILEAPERWPEIEPNVRKYRLDRFPYGIFYLTKSGGPSLHIIAVYDLRRRPGEWRDR